MTAHWAPPADFGLLAAVRSSGGSIAVYIRTEPAIVLAHPVGCIGRDLLGREFIHLRTFAAGHRGRWRYVVDTGDVRIANPLNALLLRRILALPNIDGYAVAEPSRSKRVALRALSWMVGASIHADLDEALGGMK